MSSIGQFLGSGIKSIQRGSTLVATGGVPVDVTISSVATGKSEVRFLGVSGGTGNGGVALTSATNLRVHSSASAMTVHWEITERY